MPRFNGDIRLDGTLNFPSGADNQMAIRAFATESAAGLPASGQIRFVQVGNEGYWYLFNYPVGGTFDFDAGALPSGSRLATLDEITTAIATVLIPVDAREVSGAIIPDTNSAYDLGTSAKQFASIYTASGIFVNDGVGNTIDITQAGEAHGIFVNKTTAGASGAVLINNVGTGPGLEIRQNSTGRALQIIQNATSEAVFVDKISVGAGEAFQINNAGTGDGLSISQTGEGLALQINKTSPSGADCVEITNAGTGDGLEINQAGSGIALDINKTNDGPGDGIDLVNDGSGVGLRITQNGNGIALRIQQNFDTDSIFFNKTSAGAGEVLQINNAGTGTALAIVQTADGPCLSINKTATGGGTPFICSSVGTATCGTFSQNTNAAIALRVNQNTDADGIYIDKNGTGAGDGLQIDNAGTGNGIIINQAGEALAIFINKTAAGASRAMLIENAGTGDGLQITQTGNGITLDLAAVSGVNRVIARLGQLDGDYTSTIHQINATRTSNNAFNFCEWRASAGSDPKFRVDGAGQVFSDIAAATPADYAELFETQDPSGIPVGYAVRLDVSGLLEIAPEDTTPLGFVSANPAIVTDASWAHHHNKYLKDDFGAYQLTPSGNQILNPAWSSGLPYIPRQDRPEWIPVGLLGKIWVRSYGPVFLPGEIVSLGVSGMITTPTQQQLNNFKKPRWTVVQSGLSFDETKGYGTTRILVMPSIVS